VETIKTIQSWIINTKSTPEPSYNTSPNNWQRTCLTGNNCSSPQRYLPPWKYITNKGCQNHNLQNNYTNKPYSFTRRCITCIIQCSKQMHINNNKKERCPICMHITQKPSSRYITHQMLNTMKCQINMCCVMHCQKNSCSNLQNQTCTCLSSPIIITIQIGRSRISNQMIVDHCQNRLVPQRSTLLSSFCSHRKENNYFLLLICTSLF
jgi:hypothetical protein